jgi:hypothetical protein
MNSDLSVKYCQKTAALERWTSLYLEGRSPDDLAKVMAAQNQLLFFYHQNYMEFSSEDYKELEHFLFTRLLRVATLWGKEREKAERVHLLHQSSVKGVQEKIKRHFADNIKN